MERALRPGAPDVVRSTMNKTEPAKFSAETIDSILGTPGKICIPERYIPESAPVSPDERKKRMHKAEAIRKMLSESTPILSTGMTFLNIKYRLTKMQLFIVQREKMTNTQPSAGKR